MRGMLFQAIVSLNIICCFSSFPAFGSTHVNSKSSLTQDNKQSKNFIVSLAHQDSFESQVLAELNQVRSNPSAYANWLSQIKRSIRTMEGPGVIDEAIHALRATEPMLPLQRSVGMSVAAGDHVKDQGPRGTIGHTDSNGVGPCQRVSRYGVLSHPQACSENVSYGMATPQDVVRQLIVDDGVPDRGHRRIVLNPRLAIAGVACGAHARYQTMCVIDYARTYQDRAETFSNLGTESPKVALSGYCNSGKVTRPKSVRSGGQDAIYKFWMDFSRGPEVQYPTACGRQYWAKEGSSRDGNATPLVYLVDGSGACVVPYLFTQTKGGALKVVREASECAAS